MTEKGREDTGHRESAPGRKGQATPLSLLERARLNDPQAWRQLLVLYESLVRLWCRRTQVPDQDVEEVCQEVFAAAASSLSAFRREKPGDTFRGWLRGITRNQVMQYYRRNKGRPRAQGGDLAQADLEAIPDLLAESTKEELAEAGQLYRRALEQVRCEFEDTTWQAFWRTAIDSRVPADLVEELGMSVAAIRQAKSRVLRRLKKEVGDVLG